MGQVEGISRFLWKATWRNVSNYSSGNTSMGPRGAEGILFMRIPVCPLYPSLSSYRYPSHILLSSTLNSLRLPPSANPDKLMFYLNTKSLKSNVPWLLPCDKGNYLSYLMHDDEPRNVNFMGGDFMRVSGRNGILPGLERYSRWTIRLTRYFQKNSFAPDPCLKCSKWRRHKSET